MPGATQNSHPKCISCGYELGSRNLQTCPECGSTAEGCSERASFRPVLIRFAIRGVFSALVLWTIFERRWMNPLDMLVSIGAIGLVVLTGLAALIVDGVMWSMSDQSRWRSRYASMWIVSGVEFLIGAFALGAVLLFSKP